MITVRCGMMLYAMCVTNWSDPPSKVTLDVTSNATTPMEIGQVVQFNCTSHNHREEATLEWMKVIGPTETREIAGRSVLTYTKTLTASDHGTTIYCGTWFYRPADNQGQYYYAKSRTIPIRIRGQREMAKPLNIGGEKMKLKILPEASRNASFKLGDQVSWACEAENLTHGASELRQVKGGIERKLYVGYQLGGYRWINHNFTASDNDTFIYCNVYTYDFERRIGYYIVSPPLHVMLQP